MFLYAAGLSAGISYFKLMVSVLFSVFHVFFCVEFFSYVDTFTRPDPVAEEVHGQMDHEQHVGQHTTDNGEPRC